MLKAAGARLDVSNAEGSLPVHVAPIGHFVRTLLSSEADEAAASAAAAGAAEADGLEYFNRYQQETPLTPRDFELLKVLGQGAFAKVYLVRGKGSNKSRFFAMKAYNKKSIVAKKHSQYINTERMVLTSCSNHPFIVTLHYSFQTDSKLFLVMDFCGGGDLLNLLTEHKQFTEDEARFYIAEITCGLGHLHSKGIIFRDLKPENVVVDPAGHLLLTDFGIAKAGVEAGGMDASSSTFCGSPMYLAPEMLKRAGHNHSLDWYGMGALFFELVSGLPPFYSQDRAQLFNNIHNGTLKIPQHLTAHAKDLITGLLNRDPQRRLGAGATGTEDIKRHAFFSSLDWAKLLGREISPPYSPCRPYIPGELPDLANFPPTFTSMKITDEERGLLVPRQKSKAETDRANALFNSFDYQTGKGAEEESKEPSTGSS
jgi:serine/threonine protein kinase